MHDGDALAAIQARFRGNPFNDWFGSELLRCENGESEIALELTDHHLNPGGIIHGGVIATLIDIAVGLALRSQLSFEFAHVTTQLQVNYLKPCRSGRVVAHGKAVHQGARTGYGEASLVDDRGRLLARGTGSFLIFPMADVNRLDPSGRPPLAGDA